MTTQPTLPATFRVLADALPVIEAKLVQAGKKAVKLGFPAPTLNILQWVNVKEERGKVTRYAEISVEGDAPKLNGWTFVASLQILGEESVIRTAPGQTLPKEYREADPTRWEHCNLSRKRNDTFVLTHEDGKSKQVGRTCLKDFLGHSSPESVAKYADLLFRIREEVEAAETKDWYTSIGSRAETYSIDLAEFLAATAEEIRENGWVSGKVAHEEERVSTAHIVWNKYFPATHVPGERPNPNAADRIIAEKAQEWAENLPEEAESDYLHNVRVIAGFGSVEYRPAGYAGSIIVAYKRAQDDVARASRSSGWFGTVGKREEFKLKVLIITVKGTYYLVRFENEDGYEAVWFSNDDPKLVEHRVYTVTAKVKGHDEFRGIKNTKLGYVSVETAQVEAAVVENDECPF